MHAWTPLAVSTALVVVVLAAQQPPALVIDSPQEGSFVSDRAKIVAHLEPAGDITQPTEFVFFVDGREVCTIRGVNRATCDWDAGPILRGHQIRVVARPPTGPRLTANRRTSNIDVTESSSVRVVQVTAIVTDRAGKFVSGLTKDAFRVLEDGVPQSIGHFSDADAPMELVLALDFSTSMTNFIDELRSAVVRFLAALPAKAQLTMLAFNDDVFTLARRSDSPDQGMRAFNDMKPSGGTALNDVILRGLADLSRGLGRRTLVVFTDGEDRNSLASAAQVKRAIEAGDVTVFFVALGRGREVKAFQDNMSDLSELSGGRALIAEHPDELAQRFKEVVDELSHQYLLGYDPPNPALDGAWHKLEVRVDRERLRVRARLGYRADPPPK